MKQGNVLSSWFERPVVIGVLLVTGAAGGFAQTTTANGTAPESLNTTVRELQQQVDELRSAVKEIRAEAAQYRAETVALRQEVEAMRGGGQAQPQEAQAPSTDSVAPVQQASIEQRISSLEETSQLLNSKINDQYQTKIESGSKYRVRLSGLVLVNLFSNRGQTDMTDFPSFATGPNEGKGNFGATLRQSQIGLEVFGPTIAGAKTSASLSADFSGGLVDTWNGVDSGIFRLRTASMRMDWQNTSLVVGQDDFFVSPLSPTSFASLAVPALNYAGNLWAWTPQVRVEHRFDLTNDKSITIQGGIFDNLVGEFPTHSYFRSPGPGESSGQPAYGVRTAWTGSLFGRPVTLGAGGYYTRQAWQFDHYSDGWAGMADWQIPLTSRFTLSGEFYRGRAIGGIGGSGGRSVLVNGDPTLAQTEVNSLDTIGGWSQLKFKASQKLEFNAAFGLDNPTGSEVRAAAGTEMYVGPLFTQNRGGFVNFIFRPRSNLLFSTEYRHLQSLQLYGIDNTAEQVNMMMGVLF